MEISLNRISRHRDVIRMGSLRSAVFPRSPEYDPAETMNSASDLPQMLAIPSQPSLNGKEIHLWTVSLSATRDHIGELFEILSSDEKQRASAFRFIKDRNSFVIGRGLLRCILAWYLGAQPEHVAFQYGSQGKPSLCAHTKQDLFFNLTHTEDRVLYAFTRECELGVDLEVVRDFPDMDPIADHFFAPDERAYFRSASHELRAKCFFMCWTRKEALLKAAGKGLSVPLERLRMPLEPLGPAFLSSPTVVGSQTSNWTLFQLNPMEDHVGALAIPSQNCILHERRFSNAEDCLNFLKLGA